MSDETDGRWLGAARIAEWHGTRWGEVSLVRAQLALLRAALADAGNTHFVFCSESCVPVRPFADLRRALRLDGRSRFAWDSQEECALRNQGKAKRALAQPRLPAGQWVYHPQWVLLAREAAELAAARDFTDLLAPVFAPDEMYWGTVLRLCGYPLEHRVLKRDVTWTRWSPGTAHPDTITKITPALEAEWLESGKFFARKVGEQV